MQTGRDNEPGPKLVGLQTNILIYLVLSQFLIQIGTFIYLCAYISRLENEIQELVAEVTDTDAENTIDGTNDSVRRKRSSALPLPEDNAVSEVFRVGIKLKFHLFLYLLYSGLVSPILLYDFAVLFIIIIIIISFFMRQSQFLMKQKTEQYRDVEKILDFNILDSKLKDFFLHKMKKNLCNKKISGEKKI